MDRGGFGAAADLVGDGEAVATGDEGGALRLQVEIQALQERRHPIVN